MAPASPENIINRQLELLQERSDRGLLTYDETKALESLIKLQMVMKVKSAKPSTDESLEEFSTEQLKSLIALLS